MRENKFVVLGAGGVGKTSLVVQFLEGFFSNTYKPTVEDCYRHTIQLPDGIFHTVEILDTAGSHHFPAMRELSIRSGRGFVLVFSVDSVQSFREAVQLWELIDNIRGGDVPLILVGNKSDLTENRQVSEETALQTAEETMNSCRYLETSAKFNVNVKELFVELLQQAKALEQPPQDPEVSTRKVSRSFSRRLSSLAIMAGLTLRRKSSSSRLQATPDDESPNDGKCVIL